jgi:hypothetical protein
MRLLNRGIWTAALLAAVSASTAVPATAGETASGAPENIVQAESTVGHLVSERSRVQVGHFDGTNNDSTNAAIAYAHDCTGCRSVAAAFQAVLVWGQQQSSTPENDAISVNDKCTSCTTYTFAYQDVIQTSGPSRLSRAARHQVADIREQVDRLVHSGKSPDELQAGFLSLKAQFKQVVENGIVGADERSHDGDWDSDRDG